MQIVFLGSTRNRAAKRKTLKQIEGINCLYTAYIPSNRDIALNICIYICPIVGIHADMYMKICLWYDVGKYAYLCLTQSQR